MPLVFEWDEEKARTNEAKHGVTFDEAKTVFNDPLAVTVADAERFMAERRWLDIGVSSAGRLLVVWYTERRQRIRLIGCRVATKAERRGYEENQRR
jgi:uncharacterized DUF497 family protein